MAFKKGAAQANPVLLEPIMNMEVVVPDNFMGDIIGDLNKRRGRIHRHGPSDGMQHINSSSMVEVFRYATDLRSMTQGRGSFTMEFSHYEVPAQLHRK